MKYTAKSPAVVSKFIVEASTDTHHLVVQKGPGGDWYVRISKFSRVEDLVTLTGPAAEDFVLMCKAVVAKLEEGP